VKSLKVPKLASDLVYDLRNRNLLLVVIGLLVAIVAVPVLISKSGSSSSSSSSLALQATAQTDPRTESAVLAYQPGVRNFKQRLNDLSAKDPFKQQFAPPAAAGTTLDQATSSSSTTSGQTISDSGGSSGGGSGSGGGNGGGGSKKTKTQTLYTYYLTDVAVGESGGALTPLNGISQFQFLPSQDKPVVVYLGTTSNGTQALFLVSKDVTSVGGTGTCFPTADDCQLLGLSAGAGADLIYGPDGKTYHLDVTSIRRVTSSKPPA
jgi:hypothetical protein